MAENEKRDYEGENVAARVERLSGCGIRLLVEIAPRACQAAWLKALKTINRQVSLPGFRKGRAPNEIIEKQYGEYVDREWKDLLIQSGYKEALELTGIYPWSQKTIEKPRVKKADRETGAEIEIGYETHPAIPEIDPSGLKIGAVKTKEVTKEEFSNALRDIQLHHAEWKEITDRGIRLNDYVDLDIEDIDHPGHFLCRDMRFEMLEGKMGKWMLDLLLDKKAGDTVEGVSERTKDLATEAEFKPTRCRITIKAVKEAVLPEVDDALAKKMGAETKERLLKRLRENLEKRAEEETRDALRADLEKKLLAAYPFEVPGSLLRAETDNRAKYLESVLRKSGKERDEIEKILREKRAEIEREVADSLRMMFISRSIAEKNNISVTKEELTRELMMQLYSRSSSLDGSSNAKEVREKVYMDILMRKAEDFLLEKVVIE